MANAANDKAASGTSVTASIFQEKSSLWALALGSVGVVYGDIGTSPLYAFREAAKAAAGPEPVTREIVLGVLSLILWALIVVVTIKYVLLLLRADNNGEGGTLSLTALAARALGRRTTLVFVLGVIGAAMFLGDAMITPAISVLSAVEGLKLVTPAFEHYVVPLTIVILLGLFAVQSRERQKFRLSSLRSWWSGSSQSRRRDFCTSVMIQACLRPSIRSTASAFSCRTA